MHIPKCAGQSVEMAFLTDLGLTWENRSELLLMKNKDKQKGPPFLSHLTYSDYIRYGYMSEQEMNSYHVFTVVRNPFKRIESFYKFLGYDCAISFEYFVNQVVPASLRVDHPFYYFFRPQVDFLKNIDGKLAVNECLKIEETPKLVQHLSTLGIKQLPHANKSISRGRMRSKLVRLKYWIRGIHDPNFKYGQRILWTKALAERITQLYAEDFSTLDYDLTPPGASFSEMNERCVSLQIPLETVTTAFGINQRL